MQLLVTLGEQDADFPARSGPAQVASRPGITALPGPGNHRPQLDLDLNPDPPMTAATALYQGSELGGTRRPLQLTRGQDHSCEQQTISLEPQNPNLQLTRRALKLEKLGTPISDHYVYTVKSPIREPAALRYEALLGTVRISLAENMSRNCFIDQQKVADMSSGPETQPARRAQDT
uniref:Uncharacterized protein n=1 Tax=Coccidioides posadasii RMSCC 3488 TaxID=454284 RepID=A0A0J6F6N8_COCPO|nr:hypothetical protein CPAG_01302 [Coccidioides posadasii RMSCC 3488]